MGITIDPMKTTGLASSFVVSTDGYVQGTWLDDPAMRYQLEGGIVSASQSTPLWGGLAVEVLVPAVPAAGTTPTQVPTVIAAASLATIHGFTLFNQATAGIITPSSNVPLYSSGMSVNFARLGSLLRICLPVLNTTVLNALAGASSTVALYWDPVNNCITNSSAGGTYGPLPVQLEALSQTSKTVTYSNPDATWNNAGPACIVRI